MAHLVYMDMDIVKVLHLYIDINMYRTESI